MIIALIKILVSVYIMWKISSSFDLAANFLTKEWGEGLKGPTVNAVASSLPELLISFMFLFYFGDLEGFSAGYATIIGSSIFNIACIPVISFLVVYFSKKHLKFEINKSIVFQDSTFLLLSIILLSTGLLFGVNQFLAISLILLYVAYVYFIYNKRKGDHSVSPKINLEDKFSRGKNSYINSIINLRLFNVLGLSKLTKTNSWIVIIISVLLIGGSCWLLIEVVETISKDYGVNLFVSAFFIAAIASSIPDTILSVKDAENEKFADSFSNSYGSNIFDICIGIGLPVLIYTLIYGPIQTDIPIERLSLLGLGDYILNGNIILWSVVLLFIFTTLISIIYYYYKLTVKTSITILLLYLAFVISLIIF